MKICKNCEKKEIEDEIHTIFSCNKYDNIRKKAFNDITEVDNNKLQMVFTTEGFFFLEVAIESWPEWDLNP